MAKKRRKSREQVEAACLRAQDLVDTGYTQGLATKKAGVAVGTFTKWQAREKSKKEIAAVRQVKAPPAPPRLSATKEREYIEFLESRVEMLTTMSRQMAETVMIALDIGRGDNGQP